MAGNKAIQKKGASANGSSAALCTAGLIVLAFAVIAASSFLLPRFGVPPGPPPENDLPPHGLAVFVEDHISVEMYDYFILRFVFALANVVLVAYLLFIHIKDYMRLHAKFTLGIIAFLFSFLLYALSSLPFTHIVLGPFGRGIYTFVPMLFSAIGLLIFAKLSND